MITEKETTVSLTGEEAEVEFAAKYAFFAIDNKSSDTVYVSTKPDITAGADGVVAVAGGTSYVHSAGTPTNEIYLLGDGDVQIIGQGYAYNPFKSPAKGGGGSGGTDDYDDLTNKPKINGRTLQGNKTSAQLGIKDGVDSYPELDNLPKINGVEVIGDKTSAELGINIPQTVTEISVASTDSEVPTAKAVYTYVADELVNLSQLHYVYASTLPDPASRAENTAYLVPVGGGSDYSVAWFYSENDTQWHAVGSTNVDLTGYVTGDELTAILANYISKSNLSEIVDGVTVVVNASGKITVAGGDVSENYSVLINKPQINGVTLQDNKTLEDLGIEIPETTTVITAASTGDEVPTAKAVYDLTEGKEDTANKTTSISDTPDDTKYPTEKAVADYVKENAGEGAEYMGVDPILVGFDLRGYGACVVKNYSYGTYKYYGAYAKRHYNGIIVSIYPPMLTVYPDGKESASTSSSGMSIDNNTELYGDVRDEDGNPVPEFITKNNNISLKYDDETVKVNDDGKLYAVQKEYTGDGDTVTISEDGVISAQKGIDSIKIGGRNYYKGTKDFSGNAWKMRNYWEIAEEKYNDFDVMRNEHAWHGLSQTVHVNAGESYIYSAYVKADTDDYPCAIFNKMGDTIDDTIAADDYANFDVDYRNVSVGTSWIKVSVVFTATTSGYAAFRIEKKVETDNIYLYVAGIKVEKGNKPTDWTPAPEDLEYTADDLMEAIAELAEKQEADKIETQEAIAELAESLM